MKNSFYSLNSPNPDITSISIGGFDGIHLAHQELFDKLDNSSNSAIVVIESGYSNLTPKSYRENFTDLPIYYYELSSIKHLSAEEFLDKLLNIFPNLALIVVGYDFAFGSNRTHKAQDLQNLFSLKYDGETKIVDEFKIDGISVHSKAIRDFIKTSQIQLANKLLGRNYQISGRSISGQGLGKSDFVPTINIEVNDFLLLANGVYATSTIIDDISYPSISFIGIRETTDDKFAIETHILDSQIEVNDKKMIKIEFIYKIRDNKKFESFEELKMQINLDIEEAKYNKKMI